MGIAELVDIIQLHEWWIEIEIVIITKSVAFITAFIYFLFWTGLSVHPSFSEPYQAYKGTVKHFLENASMNVNYWIKQDSSYLENNWIDHNS